MALPLENTFESGETPGTAISTANSGGGAGDAWDAVTLTGDTGLVYQNDQVAHGSLSGKWTSGGTGGTGHLRWESALGTITEAYGRMYLRINAAPASEWRVITGAGRILILNPGREIRVLPAGFATSDTTAAGLALDTTYRIEWRMVADPTTGLMTLRYYEGDSETLIEEIGVSNTDNGSALSAMDMGAPSLAIANATFWMDSIGLGTDWLGPLEPPVPDPATLRVISSPLRW